jgi:arylsulfatase A-like enzyme
MYEIGAEKPDEFWPFHTDDEATRSMIALNYGAITMIDEQVGVVMQALKNTGKSENTNIIYMSDHGDYMGDHGTILKGGVHSHGLIRVPLIWSDPANRGTDVTGIQGSAIDFAPTLLQKAGLKVPYGMQGRDLLADDVKNLPVLIEDSGFLMASDDGRTAFWSLVHDSWRMSVFEGSDLGELFNLGEDPDELDNRWADSAATSQKMAMMHLLIDRQIALRSKSLVPTHQA